MYKIETLAQYNQLITQSKAKKQLFTNNFLMASNLEKLINSNQIFAHNDEHSLLFLVEEENIFRCYYHAHDNATLELQPSAKPIVVEEIYLEKNGLSEFADNILKRSGFTHFRTTLMLKLDSKDISFVEHHYDFAVQNDFDQLKELIYMYFDPRADFIPTDDELVQAIKNNQIIVIRKQSRLAAFFYYEFKGKKMIHRLSAVHEDFRNCHLGQELLQSSIMIGANNAVQTFEGWINSQNKASLAMYQKHSFEFTGRCAAEYVL
ncbi:MAG: GNAT family N-acetyltransferase [Christensenellaceae bacterium]